MRGALYWQDLCRIGMHTHPIRYILVHFLFIIYKMVVSTGGALFFASRWAVHPSSRLSHF